MFTDKDIKEIAAQMEIFAVHFRGNSMSQSQFNIIEDAWNSIRQTYIPCVIPSDPHDNSIRNMKDK